MTDDPVCHYVRLADDGDWDADYTKIRAICGAEALLDPEGEPIPLDFDFVYEPDPRNLTDCWRCLEKLSEANIIRSIKIPALPKL